MNDLTITIPAEYIQGMIQQELDAREAAVKAEFEKTKEPKKHMRIGKYTCYPLIRQNFTTEELATVINKSVDATRARLKGKIPFSENEKILILKYLSIEVDATNKRKYFGISKKEKTA